MTRSEEKTLNIVLAEVLKLGEGQEYLRGRVDQMNDQLSHLPPTIHDVEKVKHHIKLLFAAVLGGMLASAPMLAHILSLL